MKLFVIERALALRARRPQAFAGAYAPLDAGADVCAFTRGEQGEVVVVVALRDAGLSAALDVAPGRYRDVLYGREGELAGAVAVGGFVDRYGLALLERL
jgi:maltooligosyltrehalose synthase